MNTEPQKEHQWLQKLVGEWVSAAEMPLEPGEPTVTLRGTETVRSLGGLWVVCDGQGDMPGGGTALMRLTIGFDPQKQRYVGTWVGSMMTHLWVYEGVVDASGRTLTLNTQGPVMSQDGKMTGRMTKYREEIEFKSDDHREFRSSMLGEDGAWQQIMAMQYRRKR